ncbi:unnamed protein product [Urochloa humidicola]
MPPCWMSEFCHMKQYNQQSNIGLVSTSSCHLSLNQTDKTSAAKVSLTISNMFKMSLLMMVPVLLQLPVIALLRSGI